MLQNTNFANTKYLRNWCLILANHAYHPQTPEGVFNRDVDSFVSLRIINMDHKLREQLYLKHLCLRDIIHSRVFVGMF